MTQQPFFWVSTWKNLKTFIGKDTCTCVYCSIIRGGQDMETTKVAFDGGLDKEDVVRRYYGTLPRHKMKYRHLWHEWTLRISH